MDINNNKWKSKYKKMIALAIVIVMALSSFQIYESVTKPKLEITQWFKIFNTTLTGNLFRPTYGISLSNPLDLEYNT